MPILPGITREHVLGAVEVLRRGESHPFGESTGYDLIYEGQRFAPKAAVGIAARLATGEVWGPKDFSSGVGARQAVGVLRRLGFVVVPKDETLSSGESGARGGPADGPVAEEREHRRAMWAELLARGGPKGVAPSVVRELGIYGGAQGIWVDKVRTEALTEDRTGVTVGLLHTGSAYPDDLGDDGMLYHYPKTDRPPGRDAGEVAATKAAARLGLTVFVITHPEQGAGTRDVFLSWVEGWDDQAGLFLVSFADQEPVILTSEDVDQTPFELFGQPEAGRREVVARPGQQRFKFRMLQRYGAQCAVCDLDILELLDAVHIGPKALAGSDDPRNGLVLCATHHRAFDAGYFAVEPEAFQLRYRPGGPDAGPLHVTRPSLGHLPRRPHSEAIEWRWQEWRADYASKEAAADRTRPE